jgi:hypothetical protein
LLNHFTTPFAIVFLLCFFIKIVREFSADSKEYRFLCAMSS